MTNIFDIQLIYIIQKRFSIIQKRLYEILLINDNRNKFFFLIRPKLLYFNCKNTSISKTKKVLYHIRKNNIFALYR